MQYYPPPEQDSLLENVIDVLVPLGIIVWMLLVLLLLRQIALNTRITGQNVFETAKIIRRINA